ncbi:MAG: succinate dehydrogenase cytochrome b subunit [Bacteroidota bacterium]
MVNWFSRFITSSIGKKLVMALTGLFLITFLPVHLIGNTLLLAGDGGQSFNEYAYFMTHNPLIKTVSYGLYAFILIHAIQGIILWRQNRAARGSEGYAVKVNRTAGASRISSVNMGAIGTIILVFILVHMYQFWLQMKLGHTAMVTYAGGEQPVKDLFTLVSGVYKNVGFVIFYVVSMLFIGFHLWHGFESAFQTLGLNHRKYTPLIKFVGRAYSVIIPIGFAVIPVLMFLWN